MSEVENSISTIPRAPSSIFWGGGIRHRPNKVAQGHNTRTHSINSAEGVVIRDAVSFRVPSKIHLRENKVCRVSDKEYGRGILVEDCKENRVGALHDDCLSELTAKCRVRNWG
jgi:hypothetical protein